MKETESLEEVTKRVSGWEESHFAEDVENSMAGTCILAMLPPLYRRHELIPGSVTEHGRP